MINKMFSDYGIFISIIFAENLNREEAWKFSIHTVEEVLFSSGRIYSLPECNREALKKAVDYLDLGYNELMNDKRVIHKRELLTDFIKYLHENVFQNNYADNEDVDRFLNYYHNANTPKETP